MLSVFLSALLVLALLVGFNFWVRRIAREAVDEFFEHTEQDRQDQNELDG